MDREYLTVEQLAKKIGMSEKFVRKHVLSGRLPGMVRMGRHIRFRTREVEKRLLSGQLLLEG